MERQTGRSYLDANSSDDDDPAASDGRIGPDLLGVNTDPRISYSSTDLETLIGFIKDLTTLNSLGPSDWNEQTLSTIAEFIQCPQKRILTVYYRGSVLTGSLNFPALPVHELAYFLRRDDTVFDLMNFHGTIIFGTSNDNVEATIQRLMESILAPTFFTITTWPDSAKADFCGALHEYLCSLTDLRYKMHGLTVMYLPMEGNDMTLEEACSDKELIKRLEDIVVHWSRQIKLALIDEEQSMGIELLCLIDEYDFWIYRIKNLCGLNYQLQNPTVQYITTILINTESTYIRQFVILNEEIERRIVEANSNMLYLGILKEPCMELNKCQTPSSVSKYLPTILHLYRFIWLHSPYFNTEERMIHLFSLLNNQIILVCRRCIDPLMIFTNGKTQWGIETLRKCIDACENYKEIYNQFASAHNALTMTEWNICTELVFRNIDIFVERCHDLSEICQSMRDFARMNENEEIPSPRFGGTKGLEHERVCMRVEALYHEHLQALRHKQHKIFDVQETTWHDDMFTFRNELKDLEIIIENLMNVVFMDMNNVREGIGNLHGLQIYMKIPSLRTLFDSLGTKIWRLFSDEIQRIKKEISEKHIEYPSSAPYYSGRALNLRSKAKLLESTKCLLASAEWIGFYSISREVCHQHDVVDRSIRDTIVGIYHKWIEDMGDNPKSCLDRYLMRRSMDEPALLESNADESLINICREAYNWRYLGFQIPVNVEIVDEKWRTTLQFVSESIFMLVLEYNNIIEALSFEEKSLFKYLLKGLEQKLQLGLNKFTWNSEFIDTYVKQCCDHVTNLQKFLNTYKKCNSEIMNICEGICDTYSIQMKPNYGYEFSELNHEITHVRDQVFKTMRHKYNDIIQYVLVVYEGFHAVIDESTMEWKNYVMNLDSLIEEAFRLSLKNSLIFMYEFIHGDGTTGPSPFFLVETDLIDNKINFLPSLSEIAGLFSSLVERLLEPFNGLQRLTEKFGFHIPGRRSLSQTFKDDESFHQLQTTLNAQVSHCFTQIQTYLKTWDSFRDMWEVNKDMFIARYEKLKPTVASFDADIARYTEVANNVDMQETVMSVDFLIVNSDRLKSAIIGHCSLWQQKLTALLFSMTRTTVDQLYEYMEENRKNIDKEPMDLAALQDTLRLFNKLNEEVNLKEKEFPKLQEQFQTLEKYEIPMSLEFKRRVKDLGKHWLEYLSILSVFRTTIGKFKEQFKNILLEQIVVFHEDSLGLLNKFYDNGPFTSDWKSSDALTWLENFQWQIKLLRQTEGELKENLAIFEIIHLESQELTRIEKDLMSVEFVWKLTKKWDDAWDRYKNGNFWTIELDDMDVTANTLFRKLTRLSKELKEKNWQIVEHSKTQVDKFRRTLPLITDLKNPAMRERHWTTVKRIIGQDFDERSEEFTIDALADMQMHNFVEQISEISNTASMELAIETGLKNITTIWKTLSLDMTDYKGRGIFRLQSIDEIIQTLEDHQVQLSAMKSTRFVEPFAEMVDKWERSLSTVGEVIEATLLVQKSYIYLDNIFNADDIRKQLPKETEDFDKLTSKWKHITSHMAAAKAALEACQDPPDLLLQLNKLSDKFELIQRALEQYLETKRHIFPRFYFISNDDLLEILANSKRPNLIQPHMKKLFDNIKHLKLSKSITGKYSADGMLSAEGEYVEFLQPTLLEGPVECWLGEIEKRMQDCLRDVLRLCRIALRKLLGNRDQWVREWPSQPGITSTQIQWTADCTKALLGCKLMDSKKPLRKLKKKQNQALAKYSEAIRGNLDRLQRIKFKAIVVIEIHARDVIEKMYKNNCKDSSSFEWLSQLRFYWDKEISDCVVRQTNTFFIYGYEYLGNSERLVITPLTDRCYITLTTALHLYRGGSPKGPAGTGKTETVKDLGKALGFNVIVQNCSEGADYKSMGKLFSGLAQTGAWGCFDEFNRINIEVLSVLAQQINSILMALGQNLTRFIFEGCEISIVRTCGIFITMNPGYAGRTELPDNLKSMFRPISMMVPDSSMIAEINLFGEGFENTRTLARKVFTLYTLAQQQLSKQHHYDFGLRGIVTLTRYAGKKRRQYASLPDEEIIILAMKDMNKAKLTSVDLPLFTGITSDLFPGINVPTVDYDILIEYISKQAAKFNLQPVAMLITKVIELFETKNSRHSAMIVGRSNTAKSTTWKTLRNTLAAMKKDGRVGFNNVYEYPINPKALNLGELYGEYNLNTGEWNDGVISSIMRTACSDESPEEKWIIFDGPVDAVWIENMNSVMDDNKVLTLINNDRITMPEQVSLLFEVQDLAVASPATVSRAGMVYNDYHDLGWRPLVNSWLQKFKNNIEFVEEMEKLFDWFVDDILTFKRHKCKDIVPVPELNAVESLCKLLDVMSTPENGVQFTGDRDDFNLICKIWFLFCLIWSICGSVDEASRQKIDNYIREIDGAFPLKDTVYEYYVDSKQRGFVLWEEKLSSGWKYISGAPFYKIIIPTVDTIRYNYLVDHLLANGHPVLLVGPVGTGKTSTAQSVLDSLDKSKYSLLVINMSGQTTSKNVQEAIESRLEKRTKNNYVPAGGKKMITFMDDFNMPTKDVYGSQPPLELIRQWIDYQFWYDREKQTRKYIQKMQLMGAMGPPGGGRNSITERLLTRFNVINMTFPVEKQIIRIFGTMLNQQLYDFHPEVKGIVEGITHATIGMYKNVVLTMLPTPSKMHYLFNLRDISKIFQGLLRSHKDYQYSRDTFLRLWVHEAFRVFSDRLIDDRDREWFASQLNSQLGNYFELTYHSLCPDKQCPVFSHIMNAWGIYEDITDIISLREYVEAQMNEYNASSGVVRLDLVLFRDAIEHICRIIRVISQPRGNMLLVGIGGSGRQSLSRLASYICELGTFQIEVTKHYGVMELREDLKRLYLMAGVDNKPMSFLFNDTQVVVEQFLEIINNLLSTGEVSNLYKPEEIEDIRNRLTKEINQAGILPNQESIYLFLIERVRTNMHVILCMSPVGDSFRNRLRQYPALINCTTIDWFLAWPKEALLEVGSKFLMDLSFITTITGEDKLESRRSATAIPVLPLQHRMRDAIASTFSIIHDSASQFARKMSMEIKRYCYVTPTSFLELVFGYKKMLIKKRQNLAEQSNKLAGGLCKIDDTRDKVNEMAKELELTQNQVQQSTKECDEFLVTIVNQKRDADETQKSVTARSIRIVEESKECKKLEEIAREDLATVEPALNGAMKALDALNKKDLSEIKSFTRPPAKVEVVMEAVMILKNSEPTWAESKRQLGDVNFLNSLREFNKDHITDKTLKAIGKFTASSDFDPEKVGQVSIAAKSLCMWVIAMEQYGKLFRVVAPKREKLAFALESLRQKEKALADAVSQLEKLREELERLQRMYDEKMNEKENLIKLADLLTLKLERAAMLVDGLSGEKIRWQSTVELLGKFYENLPGDCLISTGFVSYLGPFVSYYREEMIENWINEVETMNIPLSAKLNIKVFLCDPTSIREWNIQGLPSDDFSTENGIIITQGTRWPLVIDPQCQAVKWIKNMEANNDLKTIDFGTHDFVTTLEQSLQMGKPILLENVGENLDPILNPILNKELVKLGEDTMIKFNDKMISYNDNFRLFITTKLPNPHYAPEISTKTTLCNFAIKEQGLEAQLLGIVVRKERPTLEEEKDNLVMSIANGKRTLKNLEDKILHLLSVTSGSLLDDIDLLNTLQTAKVTSTTVQESLITSEKTEKEIDQARGEYRACSKRATILFFVLNNMSHIDPMYQYSLDSYITLFIISIDKSPKKNKLNERIDALNDYHTHALYKNTCRGLFERHKLLFSFHMCVKILQAQGKMDPLEYDFFLKGGIVVDRENQAEKPADWLTDETWDNITELDKLPGYHGIATSFEQLPRDWQSWYVDTEPELKPFPGEWDQSLNDFQKMLIMRSCRLDRMTFFITSFITKNIGQRFVEPPVLDVKAVLEDSVSQSPLIFVLSPGIDPTGALVQLAETRNMNERFMSLSLGQGQAPIASKMIHVGANQGNWVFLANCHLSLSWMPQLDKIVETLATNKNLHPDFRLWLSSSPTPQFPISILQAGIKMTTEPPKGLRANMKRLYGLITESQFDVCQAKEKYKKLLFSLVFFHSILLERKKFEQLGWNVDYSFNDSDFEVSENLLQVYLDEYPETPWDSLKYLIAGVCYGGHVTDDWDRRLLMTYVEQFFSPATLTEPNHRLSSLSSYYVPRDGSLESYRDFTTMLPNTDKPEAFGQHSNADITCLIIETRLLFETLMSLEIQASTDDEFSKEENVMQLAMDIESRLPGEIDYENTEKLIGTKKSPMDVVLLQEISRYNILIAKTKSSLYELQRAIQGFVLMSEELEQISTCVHEGRVPPTWLVAYPSMKSLGSWTRDLIHRVEHFSKWAETTHPPLLFWLAAYTFPTGFLTAVLQTAARQWTVSIDSLAWDFSVISGEDSTITQPPMDGVYVRGVFLEGAGWDRKRGTLVDPKSMELVCDMPVIHFRPTEQLKKKTKGLYNCPCYYYPERAGTQGRPSFVVAVDLKSGYENPEFWVKRGTALLLSLAA